MGRRASTGALARRLKSSMPRKIILLCGRSHIFVTSPHDRDVFAKIAFCNQHGGLQGRQRRPASLSSGSDGAGLWRVAGATADALPAPEQSGAMPGRLAGLDLPHLVVAEQDAHVAMVVRRRAADGHVEELKVA